MDTTTESKPDMCTSAEPQDEHRWLQQMVGEWTYEGESLMGPDQPPMKHSGTETVRAIGGFWVQGDGTGEMPGGGTAHMQFTLGYDPDKKHFVGTFVASMMPNLWVYEGTLDAGRAVLSLRADGPDMMNPGKTGRYMDVIELKSRDHRILSSHIQAADGSWQRFMVAHYRRRQP